jgi:HlyD family secretion protein
MLRIILIILVAIISILFLNCQPKKNTAVSLSERFTVKKANLKDVISQTGTIAPVVKIELKSEASGKIEKIFVKEGQKVSKRDTILIIDPYRLNTQKEKLELSIRKAEINYKFALRDYNNAVDLASSGSIAEKKVQDFEMTKDLQEIELQQQKLELQDIIDQLGKTVICSPLSGVITSLLIKEGEIAVSATSGSQSGTSIGTIADISHLEVISNIGEVDYIHLSIGQKVAVRSEAVEGSETVGTISFISLSAKKDANSELSRFEVRIAIDSIIPGIAPGINVNVDFIVLEKNNVLSIPYHYVTKTGKESFVSVVIKNKEGKDSSIQKKISTGVTDFKNFEILSGLSEGDEIIYQPENALTTGKATKRGQSK